MPRAEKMAAVDTTWLRMDQPTNRMVIVGVLLLGGPVDLDRVERQVGERLLRYPRFRQYVEQSSGGPWWCEDPHFDLARHIKRTRLPSPGGKAQLEAFVADLVSIPLDSAHPLWQFHLVEDYEGGAALVTRIHHAIADGIALIGVLLTLTDDGPSPVQTPHRNDAGLRAVVEPLLDAIEQGARITGSLLNAASSPTRLLGLAREGSGIATELAWLLAMPTDSQTRFKGALSGDKRVAWSEALSLKDVKAIGHALHCSVNDVLLASVAGALRAYLLSKGDDADGVEVRALIPVNMRPADALSGALGNHFGVLGLSLPVGEADGLARVREVRRRMDELKTSKEAATTLGLMAGLGYAPRVVQDQLFDLLLSRASAVMTNVPGPQWEMRIADAPIRQAIFWVPQAGPVGMGVSILTYNGQVQFGLITDAALVPDPQHIVDRFGAEFEKLLLHVLMSPWDGQPATSSDFANSTSSRSIASSGTDAAASA
ncbi:MAG TPA: wax ester/triacylglycerol synthase family O-acyltransferase [Acetobacteraceae bacterium]|nr:wax ester/triacylglycerol synthase family O-acyltransferase [Acetobacteraceae bacterium]